MEIENGKHICFSEWMLILNSSKGKNWGKKGGTRVWEFFFLEFGVCACARITHFPLFLHVNEHHSSIYPIHRFFFKTLIHLPGTNTTRFSYTKHAWIKPSKNKIG